MTTARLLLRWSWRDLRTHWAKVVAISVVIAIGTGGYAGLSSTTVWRDISYTASYEQLAMYDLRVDLAPGATAPVGTLAATIDGLAIGDHVAAVDERLIVATQVDASTEEATVLVRGQITGADFSDGGPAVNRYQALTGRLLADSDAGQPRVMVERSFARFYELGDTGTIEVAGGRRLEVVGQATTPEFFTVAPEGEMFMSEASFAAIFTTLETAQDLAGAPGRVNNVVLTLVDGADRDLVADELRVAFEGADRGATVSTRDDNLSYTALTTDIEQDQAMFNALAVLLIAGAVGAAFNLIHRLAEQQRREIGTGMAIGVRPALLAVRPLLVSAQIALLGVGFGVAVGTLIGNAMGRVFIDFIPLPVWDTSFQAGVFTRVAVVGFVVPFLAGAIPVWRAVRVNPIDAIKPVYATGTTSTGSGRIARPGSTLTVMPFRNLRRSPRRTMLTVLGIAAAITVLIGFLGIMDSVFGAVDTAESESTAGADDRITVTLDTFRPIASPEIGEIIDAGSVAHAEPRLQLVGSVATAADEIDVFVLLIDFDAGMWRPTVRGDIGDEPGIVLTDKAAADLGVAPGDRVVLRHPRRDGLSYTFVETQIPVVGTHPYPVRGFVYMDLSHAALFNLSGLANTVDVRPVDGATVGDVQRELFTMRQVTSVQSVTALTEAVRGAFDQIVGVIQVMAVAVVLLVLLIAFNTAAINLESRAREHATMFAFGIRVRTALRMAVVESLAVGLLATMAGVLGGLGMVWWMTQRLLTETLPDFALDVILRTETIGLVLTLGILAVAIAPLLTAQRMRHMDLPGTLRLME